MKYISCLLGIDMKEVINFLNEWQTLVGALIGAMLPVTIAILWHPVGNRIKKRRDEKEALEEVKIYTALILNDIAEHSSIWLNFTSQLRKIANDTTPVVEITLINLPPPVDMYRDSVLSKIKTRSGILHNYLLGSDKWSRFISAHFTESRNRFIEIQDTMKTSLERVHSGVVNGRDVQIGYRSLVRGFSISVENSIFTSFKNGMFVAFMLQVYASKRLRGRFGGLHDFFYKFKEEYRNLKVAEAEFMSSDSLLLNTSNIEELLSQEIYKNLGVFLREIHKMQPEISIDNFYKLYTLTPEEIEIIKKSV